MAITSRPDLIDPAIVRAGRIDQHIRCDLPTSQEREEFFTKNLGLVRLEEKLTKDEKAYSQLLHDLVQKTDGFSYGNLIGVLRGVQVDIFSKLSRYETFKASLAKQDSTNQFNTETEGAELTNRSEFPDLFDAESSLFFTEEQYASVSADDIFKRLSEIEPVGKTKEFVEMSKRYKRFETGDVDKPSYERQKQILR